MRFSLPAFALTSLLFAGCAADPEVETSDTAQAVMSENKIAMNKIAMNKIQVNRMGADRIAGDRLGPNHYKTGAATSAMLATADGRDLFGYIVGCALPKEVTLSAQVDGIAYDFAGSIGLAPEWTYSRIGTRSQHWVSACILARVNAHDISLLISLRGPSHALDVTGQEAHDYSLEEGAFYGQIFVPDDQPIIAYACEGKAQAAGEPETGPLHDRDCTEPSLSTDGRTSGQTQCGMTFTGTCADFTDTDDDDDHSCGGWGHWQHHVEAPHACEDQSFSGYYGDCHTQASDIDGDWPRHSDFDEVVTVYVSP
jgi:hypothetical protein